MLILSLKTALKAVGDENRPKFFKANFIPLESTILCLFLPNHGQNAHANTQKKFGKNGFHTLQGTMSHRPLTNASSLKITAAYCTVCMHSPHCLPAAVQCACKVSLARKGGIPFPCQLSALHSYLQREGEGLYSWPWTKSNSYAWIISAPLLA